MTIFASGFNHRTRKEERLEGNKSYRRQNIDGVEFIWIRTSPYYRGNDWRRAMNMLSYSFRVIVLGLKSKNNPDVILAATPHPFAGLSGWFLAKHKRARFIFDVLDLWPQTLIDIGDYSSKSLVVKLLGILERFLYQRAERIIAVMPKASDYIRGLGILSDKVVYIPNCVNPELFSNGGTQLAQELSESISSLGSKGRIIVGYIGAHGIADALDTIVDAAGLLQDKGLDKVHFLLVGDGPEKKRLTEKAANRGLKNIDFFNPIPNYTMPIFLKSINIAVITKRKTALYKYGVSFLKIFDYMSCARPVVWAVDSFNNPVADANCGITVEPENPEALADAIMKMCSLSAEERREMGKRGYDYVMKYHSVPVLVDRLLEVIEDA